MLSLFLIWQGNKGFNLWDEGYLWYGAQRVMLGEVPIRDFMAYDPGRYYWSATVMSLLNDNGIMALRAAVAIFQTMGIICRPIVDRAYRKKTRSLVFITIDHYVGCMVVSMQLQGGRLSDVITIDWRIGFPGSKPDK